MVKKILRIIREGECGPTYAEAICDFFFSIEDDEVREKLFRRSVDLVAKWVKKIILEDGSVDALADIIVRTGLFFLDEFREEFAELLERYSEC